MLLRYVGGSLSVALVAVLCATGALRVGWGVRIEAEVFGLLLTLGQGLNASPSELEYTHAGELRLPPGRP